jgi:N-acetylmuramoyl-L-alanine amidase
MSVFKSFLPIFFIVLSAFFLSQKSLANSDFASIKSIKFTPQNNLEILISKKTNFKIFTLSNPNRLVVDIENGSFEQQEPKIILPNFISQFRSKNNENSLRLVFELGQKITLEKIHFEKNKNQNFGKIVAKISGVETSFLDKEKDLQNAENSAKEGDFILEKLSEFEVQTSKVINADGTAKYLVKKIPINLEKNSAPKIPVIVIDSGHGGKDPGTIGNFARTKEKNLTLSYAKELGKQLINTKRYKVYLTRDDDRFIPLRKRVEFARKKKADLFISLHANAISDDEISGFSIYTLSEKSSDKQAELLAQKENRADIISGVNFSDASPEIVKTLIDLSQRETMNGSSRFAFNAVKSIKNSEINILQNTHRFAGFAVLTAPDTISVLIELGYLSNQQEEKMLNSISYKRKVSQSLVEAIDEYFAQNKI